MSDYILEAIDVSKSFLSTKALDQISLHIKNGEIHAICGENGAGKSTLMNIISGVYSYGTYSGQVLYNGKECQFKSIRESEQVGISIIHQHLALVPYLSIAENIFLGNEQANHQVIDWNLTRKKAKDIMATVGLKEDPDTKIMNIGVGKQQLVEICKAITRNVQVLILDEPTAALNDAESENLLNLLLQFKKQGITSILISHKLHELTEVCDAITIIRDGREIETLYKDRDILDENRIIRGMVGREMSSRFPERESCVGDVVLEVRDWVVYDPLNEKRQVIKNASFDLREGEVLGIAGLMGAGRTELAMSIFGRSYGVKIGGSITKQGKTLHIKNVSDAISSGIAYVSEDRHTYGLIKYDSVKRNITLPNLKQFVRNMMIDENKETVVAEQFRSKLNIKSSSVHQPVSNLSGGNQQKVIFSKWVLSNADVMILDEPTRGIDVGSKYEIYQVINQLVHDRKSVIMISSDMVELLGMCDRIYVMNEGRIVGELVRGDITQENIMSIIMQAAKEEDHSA